MACLSRSPTLTVMLKPALMLLFALPLLGLNLTVPVSNLCLDTFTLKGRCRTSKRTCRLTVDPLNLKAFVADTNFHSLFFESPVLNLGP